MPADARDVTWTAVKHFKHEERGKRRLHKRPTTAVVTACHPWLDAELRAVDVAQIRAALFADLRRADRIAARSQEPADG